MTLESMIIPQRERLHGGTPDGDPVPAITALYTGVLGLMSIAVALPAGKMRTEKGISVGDGGDIDLTLAMRRHANFVEFVPLTLILIGLLEMNGVPNLAIHAFGALLVVFRICHAVGFKADSLSNPLRGIGAGGSTRVVVVTSVWAIVTYL
jgi:uncharacterized membrane protein YecN with MAPEG domain